MSTRISDIRSLDDCDEVTADDLESCRKELGCTPAEIAERLGWSVRKYQRTIDAVREDEAPRDVVLSFVGLVKLAGLEPGCRVPHDLMRKSHGAAFFQGVDHSDLLNAECVRQRDEGHEWTADVTPHVIRALALQASQGRRITYNDLAEVLEGNGDTHRVWPRTAYGRPLGSVCSVTTELGRITHKRIPLLSVIVVKQDGSPGEGFDGMTKEFFKANEAANYRELMNRMRTDREGMITELQEEVLTFPYWGDVLETLGIAR